MKVASLPARFVAGRRGITGTVQVCRSLAGSSSARTLTPCGIRLRRTEPTCTSSWERPAPLVPVLCAASAASSTGVVFAAPAPYPMCLNFQPKCRRKLRPNGNLPADFIIHFSFFEYIYFGYELIDNLLLGKEFVTYGRGNLLRHSGPKGFAIMHYQITCALISPSII